MTSELTAVFYFSVVLLSALLAHISENGRTKIGLVLSTLLLVIVGGLRSYDVGIDTIHYKEGIEYFFINGEMAWNHAFSVPYGWFTSGILHVYNDYTFLLVVEAAITNGLFAMRLWDYRDRISLSFAMFVYASTLFPLSLCLTCQMMAVSIVFYAVRFLDSRKPVVFCVFLVVASLIHISAAIMVLALVHYVLNEEGSEKRSHIAVKLLGIAAIAVGGIYASAKLLDRYAHYSVNESNVGLMVFAQLAVLIFALLASGYIQKPDASGKEDSPPIMKISDRPVLLYIVGIALSASSYVIANAGRIAYYFTIFGPVVFGAFVKGAGKSKSRFVLGMALGIWFLFYAWYAYLLHTGLGIESYSFVWMK